MASMCFLSTRVLPCITRRSLQSVQPQFRTLVKMTMPLDKIPDVDIDGNGTFKYILVTVHDDNNKQSKNIVRGYARSTWHGKIPDRRPNNCATRHAYYLNGQEWNK